MDKVVIICSFFTAMRDSGFSGKLFQYRTWKSLQSKLNGGQNVENSEKQIENRKAPVIKTKLTSRKNANLSNSKEMS
jgi:hypothetical protein